MPRPKKVKVLAPKEFSEVKDLFAISLRLGDKIFTGKGATVLEALENLEKPTKIFLKGIVTLTYGEKKSKEIVLTVPRIKRLFYPVARFHVAKQLALFIK